VFGERGVGKTRLVIQVAEYLRYRYMFRAGVHYFDLSKMKNIDNISLICKKKVNKSSKEKRQTFGNKRSVSQR
jgi:nucleoside-triphosphatase THEP1